MDINLLKNFEYVSKALNNSNLLKIQEEISTMIINQSFNSMTSIANEISKTTQIQAGLLKNESLLIESTIQNLFKESKFLKKQQEISNIIMNQSYDSLTKLQNEILKISQIQLDLFKNNSLIFENVTQQLLNNKNFSENSFNIKYEDIEKINKKIEQKKAFTKKDLLTLLRFVEIVWLFYSIYSALNPDNSEHIKTQQMIYNLDNKISKSLKQAQYYEVTKQVNIRELADSKSKKIAVANPKQKLLIIQNKPYWLQIEYFDEIKNETIIGWVSKKYTKRLD